MSRRLKPYIRLEGAQDEASDPQIHASLSASAGTGKTHVLTSRVLRLLLRGTPPSAILCLTFTKAGAAEMANRLGERLAHWVRLPDDRLRKELFALNEDDSPPALARARRLFAEVLDAPGGGLRIQTIHAFAQTLLAAFPAEAGIAPGFRPIEGRAEGELARRTLATLLADADASGRDSLLDDVSALSLRLGEAGAEAYLMNCARAATAMAELGEPEAIEGEMLGLAGLVEGEELVDRLADGRFDEMLLHRLARANTAWGTDTGRAIAGRLTAFLAASPEERIDLLDKLATGIVTTKGELCKIREKQRTAEPDYEHLAERLTDWWGDLAVLVRAVDHARLQAAGLRAGQAFAAAYVAAKRAAGVADFGDLIAWTRALLQQPGMGDWVRYKLDQRTDHILVDEAQDTNADQWAIVDALAEEFFSGNPDSEQRRRTLLMVGAAAAAVGRARAFRRLSIDASFRSSPAVLDLVDGLIGEVGHLAMGLKEPPPRHLAFHQNQPGRVEWWPAFEVPHEDDSDEGEEGWIAEPVRLYADALARQVRDWLADAPVLASTGRPMTPGDVLILIRSRGELASLIVARLYAQGVPVAGIDRLHLHKPLAVKDLLAAMRFAVQPLDDLNLAGLLVSPLVGWDQDQLFGLAHGRKGRLWDRLQSEREAHSHWRLAHAILAEWLRVADFVAPAAFLELILSGPLDGRRKLLERLGEAARDPIAELVATALAFEAEQTPTLERFLAWFGDGEVEVKRDPSAPADAVRVMTVHGAKGLEAPVVVLADATHDPDKVGGTSAVMDFDIAGVGTIPLVRPRKAECALAFRHLLEQVKQADAEEHWRLAYVALTRAKEWLIIAGARPKRDVPAQSWHRRTGDALTRLGARVREDERWGAVVEWESGGRAHASAKDRRALSPIAVPGALRRLAPEESRPPRPLSPSQLTEDRDSLPPPSPEMRAAAARGVLLHQLFERLPGVVSGDRRSLALRWLEREEAEESDEIADSACAILSDPRYADLFAPGSLAEAPIAATLPDGRVIAGTVDRLCVGPDVVRMIDFKTGRQVPRDAASIPAHHRVQMEAYAAALRVIFPGRRVEAALLYTSGPRLIELDA
jgi:ATP-dependent helicase/nuclease subunit A